MLLTLPTAHPQGLKLGMTLEEVLALAKSQPRSCTLRYKLDTGETLMLTFTQHSEYRHGQGIVYSGDAVLTGVSV